MKLDHFEDASPGVNAEVDRRCNELAVDHIAQVTNFGRHLLSNAEGEIEGLRDLGQLIRRRKIDRDACVEQEDVARQISPRRLGEVDDLR
jgi:hypothetical protein